MDNLVLELYKGYNINKDITKDIFCVIKHGLNKYETKISKAPNPVWNEIFEIPIDNNNNIIINCYVKNIVGRDHIGEIIILPTDHKNINLVYAKKHKYPIIRYGKTNKLCGEIEIKMGIKSEFKKIKINTFDKCTVDEINEIEAQTLEIAKETNKIANNILNIANQNCEIGNYIIEKLEKDEQKIYNLSCDTDAIRNDIIQGSRRVRSIKSPIGTLKNMLTSKSNMDSKIKSRVDRKMLKIERKEDALNKKIEQKDRHYVPKDNNYNMIKNFDQEKESTVLMGETDSIINQVDLLLDTMINTATIMGNKIKSQNEKLDVLKSDINDINPKIQKLVQQTKRI